MSRDRRPDSSGPRLRFPVVCSSASRSFFPFVSVEAIHDPIQFLPVPEVVLVVLGLFSFF